MAAAVARVEAVMREGRYLHLPYTTLFEYLKVRCSAWRTKALMQQQPADSHAQATRWQWGDAPACLPSPTACSSPPDVPQYLHAIARALAPGGPAVLFYLAAAVSDFFMPWADMVRGGCWWAPLGLCLAGGEATALAGESPGKPCWMQ